MQQILAFIVAYMIQYGKPDVFRRTFDRGNAPERKQTMKIETLRERIAKAEEKIIKKQNTIVKKTALREKKLYAAALGSDMATRRCAECDAKYLAEDIKRLESEIKETEKTLENYRAQLAGEIKRQDLLTKEVPENLKTLQKELVTEWDRYDKNRRARMQEDRRTMDYHEYCMKYRGQNTELRTMTDEQIHDSNVQAAEAIILNLVNRVKSITGEITSWGHLFLNPDNNGWSVLNGYVEGKEGRAYVESIGAGGYNIQRYHIRVLVKSF